MIARRPFAPPRHHDVFIVVALAATFLIGPRPGFAGEVWPVGGVRVSPSGVSSQLGKVAPDGDGGVIVAYAHNVGVDSLVVTKVNASGAIEWGPVEICPSVNGPSDHVITADGAGGAVLAWEDRRAGGDPVIYAQRINGSGTTLWAEGGIPVCSLAGWYVSPIIAPDGAGGAVIAWRCPSPNEPRLRAQRLLANGAVAPGWNEDSGTAICAVPGESASDHTIAADGSGGAILAWTDGRAGSTDSIYANRVGGDGSILWAVNGIEVASDDEVEFREASIVSDGSGGAVIAYHERTWYTEENRIHARRINGAGQAQWDSVLCAVAPPDHLKWTWSASDGAGGAVVAWHQKPPGGGSGSMDVYARRVDAGGNPLWPDCGVRVSTLGDVGTSEVSIAADGGGGAILTWHDRTDSFYVLAQHLDGAGNALWQAGGLDLDPGADHPFGPVVTPDGHGGGLFAWEGDCSVWCVYAQRILDASIFADGFESGDTTHWSTSVPLLPHPHGQPFQLSGHNRNLKAGPRG